VRHLRNLPLLSGLFLAGISLYFSATGLVHLFAGAGLSILVMAIAFETAKVAITLHLIQNFRVRLVPLLLTVGLLCLVGISSLGIYGYLGRAYDQGRTTAVTGAGTIEIVASEITAIEADRDRLLRQVESIPAAQGTNRRRMLATVQPEIDRLSATITEKRTELSTLRRSQITAEQDIGELRFAADLFGTTQDGLAKLVITVLAFLLDPLAVLLLLASGVKGQRLVMANGATIPLAPSAHPDTMRGVQYEGPFVGPPPARVQPVPHIPVGIEPQTPWDRGTPLGFPCGEIPLGDPTRCALCPLAPLDELAVQAAEDAGTFVADPLRDYSPALREVVRARQSARAGEVAHAGRPLAPQVTGRGLRPLQPTRRPRSPVARSST
jgi:hypothetical protein